MKRSGMVEFTETVNSCPFHCFRYFVAFLLDIVQGHCCEDFLGSSVDAVCVADVDFSGFGVYG